MNSPTVAANRLRDQQRAHFALSRRTSRTENRACKGLTRRRVSRHGLTRIEVIVIALIVLFGALMTGPWLLQQRASARKRTCSAKQLSVARAHLLYADDRGRLAGFANPPTDSLFDFSTSDDGNHSGKVSAVQATLIYLYALSGDQEQRTLEALYQLRDEGGFPEGRYYQELTTEQQTGGPLTIPAIPEMNCPDQTGLDYQKQPDSSTTIFNCGMPDVPGGNFPPDWRANGPFLDLTNERSRETPVSLNYIDNHDGLSTTFLLSENIDSGGWLDTEEPDVGFVWLDMPTGKLNENLFGINRRTGERESPDGNDYRFARPSSYHVGGVNVVFCDGSTQFLSEKIDYVVFALLMSCDDTHVMKPGTRDPVSQLYRREPVTESDGVTADSKLPSSKVDHNQSGEDDDVDKTKTDPER